LYNRGRKGRFVFALEGWKMVELKKLGPKHRMALRLLSLGSSRERVASELGISIQTVRAAEKSSLGQEYMQGVEKELDQDFKRLYKKVISTIEEGLDCSDARVALASANIWLKAHGKFVQRVETRDLTAEDIIQKIVKGELVPPTPPSKDIPALKGVVVYEEGSDVVDAPFKELN
jgi:hypothetical protein